MCTKAKSSSPFNRFNSTTLDHINLNQWDKKYNITMCSHTCTHINVCQNNPCTRVNIHRVRCTHPNMEIHKHRITLGKNTYTIFISPQTSYWTTNLGDHETTQYTQHYWDSIQHKMNTLIHEHTHTNKYTPHTDVAGQRTEQNV